MHKRLLSSHGVKSLKVAVGLLRSRGIAARQCLRGTGVTETDLGNPDVRIALEQELTFYRNVLELTGDPLIGLAIGAEYRLPSYGIWGYAVMSAPDLHTALARAFRFIYLTYTCHDITLDIARRNSCMRLVPLRDYAECSQVITDRDVSALFHLASEMLGRRLPLTAIEFIHHGGAQRKAYRDYFDCPVEFGQRTSAIHVPPAVLTEPLPHSDPTTARLAEHQCELLITRLNRGSSLSQEIETTILARPGHFPTVAESAHALGLSTRNLRRQLAADGVSYSGLVTELRYRLACQYLELSGFTLQQIANALGYSEASNFTHAFKRWSGVSPQRYRSAFLSHGQLPAQPPARRFARTRDAVPAR